MKRESSYDDIINLPHHVSKNHPQMSMEDRAAQFSPYAALVGFDSVIDETGRTTDAQIELDEEALTELNMKFQQLKENLEDMPEVSVTFFKPDSRKEGGAYLNVTGTVKKLDEYEHLITLFDGTKIPMRDIIDLDLK